jgi:dTDP-4-amino-4,6-dideoxygalactose transaminase
VDLGQLQNAVRSHALFRSAVLGVTQRHLVTSTAQRHHHVIRVGGALGTTRTHLMSALQTAGVACGLHCPTPLHLQPAAAELGYTLGVFPVGEELAGEILSLPIFAEMTREMVTKVEAALRS